MAYDVDDKAAGYDQVQGWWLILVIADVDGG